jgi:hypothetical protein
MRYLAASQHALAPDNTSMQEWMASGGDLQSDWGPALEEEETVAVEHWGDAATQQAETEGLSPYALAAGDGWGNQLVQGDRDADTSTSVDDYNRMASKTAAELESTYVALQGLSHVPGVDKALQNLPAFISVLRSEETAKWVGRTGMLATAMTSFIAVQQAYTGKGRQAAMEALHDCLTDAGVHGMMNTNPYTAAIDLALTAAFGADWPSKGFKHKGALANDITAALEGREADRALREKHAFWASGSPEAKEEMDRLKRDHHMQTVKEYDIELEIPPVAGDQEPRRLHIHKLVLGLTKADWTALPAAVNKNPHGEWGLKGYIQRHIARNPGLQADIFGQDGLVDESVMERLHVPIKMCGEKHSRVEPTILGLEGRVTGPTKK